MSEWEAGTLTVFKAAQQAVRSGERTDRLDLQGRDRAINRIDMVYRRRPDFRGRATVCAEGLVG